MLDILTHPHPTLRQRCLPIKDPTSMETKRLIADMLETMRAHEGLGLAAPQVGQSLQLCVIELENEVFVLINPEIKKLSGQEVIIEEGCLSFPGKFIPISRSEKVRVVALDETGKKRVLRAKGLLARALQHEIDHLNGRLFIDLEQAQ